MKSIFLKKQPDDFGLRIDILSGINNFQILRLWLVCIVNLFKRRGINYEKNI
jgi:hypothetical protein